MSLAQLDLSVGRHVHQHRGTEHIWAHGKARPGASGCGRSRPIKLSDAPYETERRSGAACGLDLLLSAAQRRLLQGACMRAQETRMPTHLVAWSSNRKRHQSPGLQCHALRCARSHGCCCSATIALSHCSTHAHLLPSPHACGHRRAQVVRAKNSALQSANTDRALEVESAYDTLFMHRCGLRGGPVLPTIDERDGVVSRALCCCYRGNQTVAL